MKVFKAAVAIVCLVSVLWASGIVPQAYGTVQANGSSAAQASILNFVNGMGVTWSCTTSAGVTACTATGTGGGTALPNYSQSFTSQTSVTLTHNAGTTAVVIECYDGSGNAIIPQNVVLTDANNAVVTFGASQTGKCVVNSSGISTAVQNWQKVTVGFAQLTTAGLTQTINLITTSARTKVCGVSIKTTAAFSGGLIATLTVSVGDAAGTGTDYAPAFTIFSAPSATNYQDTIPATVASKTSAASTITALFTSTVGNLNTATAGSVDIDVCTAVIP